MEGTGGINRIQASPHPLSTQILTNFENLYLHFCMHVYVYRGHRTQCTYITQISNSSELHADWQVQFASETFLLAMKC